MLFKTLVFGSASTASKLRCYAEIHRSACFECSLFSFAL